MNSFSTATLIPTELIRRPIAIATPMPPASAAVKGQPSEPWLGRVKPSEAKEDEAGGASGLAF